MHEFYIPSKKISISEKNISECFISHWICCAFVQNSQLKIINLCPQVPSPQNRFDELKINVYHYKLQFLFQPIYYPFPRNRLCSSFPVDWQLVRPAYGGASHGSTLPTAPADFTEQESTRANGSPDKYLNNA